MATTFFLAITKLVYIKEIILKNILNNELNAYFVC